MPFTLCGFSESQDSAAVFVAAAALADPHVTVSGDDIRIPDLDHLIGIYASGVGITRAQLRSPSLRVRANHEVAPINRGAIEPANPAVVSLFPRNPIKLAKGESLNAFTIEDTVGAEREYVLIWLSGGPLEPVVGEEFSVRVTGSATLTADAWTNAALTFDQALPVGKYQVVGARFNSTGLVAFRFVPVGNFWRPGALGVDAASDLTDPLFRHGGLGVWFEFDSNTPPTVDFLSNSADTAEAGELDLIKVG